MLQLHPYKYSCINKRISSLLLIVALGLFSAVLYSLILDYVGFGFPHNPFLFHPADRFNDWHNSVVATASQNPYFSNSPAVSTYFPFSYWVLSHFTYNPRSVNSTLYLSISLALLITSCYYSWRFQFHKKEVKFNLIQLVFIFALSYPAIFALDRGNLDIWIASFCVIYCALLKTRLSLIGYIFLSIAIMFKGYPAAFLLLSISQKKYFSAFLCLLGSIFISLIIMSIFWGGFSENWRGLQINLSLYQKIYVMGGNSLFASSDPFNGIRTLMLILKNEIQIIPTNLTLEDFSASLIKVYFPISFTISCIAAIFITLSNGQIWMKTAAISLVILMFPNVANDYKLCILFPAVLSLLAKDDYFDRTDKIAFVIFGLLLIPKSYIFIKGYHLSNIVNPLLIILLSSITFLNPFRWRGMRSKRDFLSH